MIHLVTGGARSGKSAWALARAEANSPPNSGDALTLIATAEALDDDMAARIARHRAERSSRWRTLEVPLDLPAAIAEVGPAGGVVDCLTLWISNLLFANEAGEGDSAIATAIEKLVAALDHAPGPIWVVTNEVGLGIVPADPLSRRYRDLLGRCNQRLAARADHVTLLVAGLPLSLK